MTTDATYDAAVLIAARSEERFQSRTHRVHAEADRLFGWLMLGQWAFAIALAMVYSPYGWEGKTRVLSPHVPLAVVLGGILSSLPVYLAFCHPGKTLTRHVIAVAQMLWSALLIHLTGGRIETHFHVFGSLAFLAFYRDWRVLLTATLVVATEHFLRGIFWPESIYGIVNPEWWRFLEHAFWVIFCDAFLILACIRGVNEMRELAEQGAHMEALAQAAWSNSPAKAAS
ncbi:MAG TPA: hypothetical protein VJM31_12700 [Vicinamibacterales bacterium]|nr:hypothetical protein [Vicinamibacterales bacterium]